MIPSGKFRLNRFALRRRRSSLMGLSTNIFAISRKIAGLTLVATAIVNIIFVFYFQLANLILDLQSTLQGSSKLLDFQKEAFKLFQTVASDKDRFWFADSTLRHVIGQVEVTKVFSVEGKESSQFFYDPRLTLAVYLDELRVARKMDKPLVLPFRWTDWMDLTPLNDENSLKGSKVMTCERIQRRSQRRPDTSRFCKNKDQVTDEEAVSLGYNSKEQLPPSIIFGHCDHQYYSFNDVRVYMAKSYALTYLPKLYKVIILNKDRGTYEFDVDQRSGPDQRMIHRGMLDRFAVNVLDKAPEQLMREKVFTVDHLSVYKKLRMAVEPTVMARSEDVFSMHEIVSLSARLSKDISLTEASFHYPREIIQKKIGEYENIPSRTVQQNSFLNGLKESWLYDGSSEPEYFKMATLNIRESRNSINDWGWHYDWRFFNDALFYEKAGWTKEQRVERTKIILERLLRNWNRFAEEKGLVSWIMHGPLLSWYWDGLMFPFDVDIDIQMPISELVRLGEHYNQTLVVEDPTEGYGRFLIDVGTYIHNRDISYTGNHIDARFIDVDSGIYIDITGLAKSTANLPEEYAKNPIVQKGNDDEDVEVYNDCRKHFYTFDQLLPLHYSMLGGVPIFVPNSIEARLRFEYPKGLDDYEYNGWYFVPKLKLWVMKNKLSKVVPESQITRDGQQIREMIIDAAISLTDQQAADMLKDDDILMEYYLTHKHTEWHLQEKELLFDVEGKDNMMAFKDPKLRAKYTELTGQIKMDKPMRKCLYEYERFDRELHAQ